MSDLSDFVAPEATVPRGPASEAGPVAANRDFDPTAGGDADPLNAEDLRAIIFGLKRRLGVMILIVAACGILAAIRSSRLTTIYASSARLRLAKEAPDPTRAKYVMSWDGVQPQYLSTQIHVLQSHSLATEVVKSNPKIAQELELDLGPGATPEALGRLFRAGIKVTAVEGTYLVDVSYHSPRGERCARYANALAAAYKSQLESLWGQKTRTAEIKIGEQADLLFKKLGKSEEALRTFLNDPSQAPMLAAHEQLLILRIKVNDGALARIQGDRIRLTSELEAIQRAIDAGHPLESSVPLVDQKVFYDLRTHLANAALSLNLLREKYGEEWHEVKAARGRHEQLRLLLRAEVETIRARIKSQRDAKISEEQGLLQRSRLLREESRALAQRQRLFESLQAEVLANRSFYDEFAKRLNELTHYSRVNVTNARVVDQASGFYPVSPNHPRNVMLGVLFGVALALVVALLLERLSDQLRTVKDAVTVLDLPVLAVVPEQRNISDLDLLAVRDTRSVYAESFRRARVQLNAVGAYPDEGCGVLMCASGVPREGKTLSSINLAIASAQAGRRTILVDADMRSPRVHRVFGMERRPGLAEALAERRTDVSSLWTSTSIENLVVLSAGGGRDNPGELLARDDRFARLIAHLRTQFDRVILDSPPIAAVSDGTLMAPHADAVLLVVSAKTSSRGAALRARADLGRVGREPIGLLFNQQSQDEASYYYYYSRYGYGGGPEDQED
ncbi:MAG: polysaccharide biosynthesis tyrosine autokinase [Planctomycetes bacterium]|nr:polysaccharide biosynthesis tyrosine autokinase [Planctomycetota bacterium]